MTDSNNPLFSVISVSLNDLEGLKKTYQSIKSQSCTDYEWIVQDGGSGDTVVDFLKETSAKWESKPDGGIYDAMNKALERANGKYLIFLNSGDFFAGQEILRKIKEIIEAQLREPDLIYGDSFDAVEKRGFYYKKARDYKKMKKGLFTHHQAMFYNASSIKDVRYNTEYKSAADYDFTYRFLQNNRRISYCNFAICHFSSGGLSRQKPEIGRAEQKTIRSQLKICSALENEIITTQQALGAWIRKTFPGLYIALKRLELSASQSSDNTSDADWLG